MIPALSFKTNQEIEESFQLVVQEITYMVDQQHLDNFVIEQIGKQTSFVYISKQIN